MIRRLGLNCSSSLPETIKGKMIHTRRGKTSRRRREEDRTLHHPRCIRIEKRRGVSAKHDACYCSPQPTSKSVVRFFSGEKKIRIPAAFSFAISKADAAAAGREKHAARGEKWGLSFSRSFFFSTPGLTLKAVNQTLKKDLENNKGVTFAVYRPISFVAML